MLNWKALSPHRPLDAGDLRYVARPDGGGARLAQLVAAGVSPIGVTGPVGSGKSTELARAADLLGTAGPTFLIPLDRLFDMRRISEAHVLTKLYQTLSNKTPPTIPVDSDHVLNSIRNAKTHFQSITLLIDGLEKTPENQAHRIALEVLRLADEARIVLVVPPALAVGPVSYSVTSQTKIFTIRASSYWNAQSDPVKSVKDLLLRLDREPGTYVSPPQTTEPRAFLYSILMQRLGLTELPPSLLTLAFRAAQASGGLPRAFLQLMQDAGTYATLAGREMPEWQDLKSAMDDQADSLTLLLQDGDAKALANAFGTDGLEVPLERKLRFLTHGLLLEYEVDGNKLVFPAPLLKKAFFKYLPPEPAAS